MPRQCYSAKDMEAYQGIVLHYVSAKYVLPEDPFNLDMIWWMLRDLNTEPTERYTRLIYDSDQKGRQYASYHYLIGRAGEVMATVHPKYQAYHAGVSLFRDRKSCNRFMLGIGMVNDDVTEYTKQQYDSSSGLCAGLCAELVNQHLFELDAIVGHSDVAPGRKEDPGPMWDWTRFRRLVTAKLG